MLSKFIRGLLAGLLLMAAGASQAASHHVGILAAGDNAFGIHSVAAGSFQDTFNFTLPGLGHAGIGAGVLNFTLLGSPFLNISDFNVALFNGGNVMIAGQSGSNVDFSAANLAAGDYRLVITATATGTGGGAYSGAISYIPVPEADTWLMLLAGLGIVGLLSARSRSA